MKIEIIKIDLFRSKGETMKTLILCTLFLAGCSIDTSKLAANQDQTCQDQPAQTSGTQTGSAQGDTCQDSRPKAGTSTGAGTSAATAKSTSQKPATTTTKDGTHVKVTVEVDSDSTKTTTDQSTAQATGTTPQPWLFMPQQVTQNDAVANAPQGYHLPSRTELTDGYDNGDFTWASNELIMVWSATSYSDDPDTKQGWYMSLLNGDNYHAAASMRMPSVYRVNQ